MGSTHCISNQLCMRSEAGALALTQSSTLFHLIPEGSITHKCFLRAHPVSSTKCLESASVCAHSCLPPPHPKPRLRSVHIQKVWMGRGFHRWQDTKRPEGAQDSRIGFSS